MTDVAIGVHNLGKLYRIGASQNRHETLREQLTDAFAAPFRRVWSTLGQRRSADGGPEDTIWALKDVSFDVKRGEVVGIIGRNGAGKSTLLKILARITDPTEGRAEIRGRVASLLEVGTGFSGELTGRENIYLSGSILGMRRAEIDRKFDEIVEFSGVEKFIDTPLKRYSSGMGVRLAFAVAAHLEPEILLVDEVLAVGDVAFQKKCLGKMGSVVKEGRTVLFVSHSMSAIRALCPRTLYLDCGRLVLDSDTESAVAKYLDEKVIEGAVAGRGDIEPKMEGVIDRRSPSIRLHEIALLDEQGIARRLFESHEAIRVAVTYECLRVVHNLAIYVLIGDEENRALLLTMEADDPVSQRFYRRDPGLYESSCLIPTNLFGGRRYYVTVELANATVEHLVVNKILSFDVRFGGYNDNFGSDGGALIRPRLSWRTRPIGSGHAAV